MKASTTKMMMKAVGATLGVCSAVVMTAGVKANPQSTKKMMKKTVNKVASVIDAVNTFM